VYILRTRQCSSHPREGLSDTRLPRGVSYELAGAVVVLPPSPAAAPRGGEAQGGGAQRGAHGAGGEVVRHPPLVTPSARAALVGVRPESPGGAGGEGPGVVGVARGGERGRVAVRREVRVRVRRQAAYPVHPSSHGNQLYIIAQM
jgi:hypothetical protein